MEALEQVLSSLSIFDRLRPDEIGRIASRFVVETMQPGATRHLPATVEDGRFLVVVAGEIELTVEEISGSTRSTMSVGDRYGELALLTGHVRAVTLRTEDDDAIVAMISRDELDATLEEFPAIALPLAQELASELRAKLDLSRQLLELHAEGLPEAQLRAAVEGRRRAIRGRGARVSRLSPRALFRNLVVARGAEPPFWMLVGFLVSLGLARLVVAMILKFHLEKQLFALVPGTDPNPMHVHHFNYGLILIGAAGLAALLPLGRRALRTLAFAFGFGAGLFFDEFALFWNLNPDYRQSGSLLAAGIAAVVLVQLVYFRGFWTAIARRAWYAVRRAR